MTASKKKLVGFFLRTWNEHTGKGCKLHLIGFYSLETACDNKKITSKYYQRFTVPGRTSEGTEPTGAELSPRFVGFTAVLVETSRILRQLALCKAWSWVSCEAVEICNLHSHFWRTNPWIIHLRTHLSNGFIPTPLVESPSFQVNQSDSGSLKVDTCSVLEFQPSEVCGVQWRQCVSACCPPHRWNIRHPTGWKWWWTYPNPSNPWPRLSQVGRFFSMDGYE